MRIIKFIKKPSLVIVGLGRHGLLNWIPDRTYLKLMYKIINEKNLNLNNPKTYNEKLQWIKLYDHNAVYPILVDKCKVREFVSNRIGDQYLIPLIGKWKNANDIDFTDMPNQFVLKCNHDSGSVIICTNKDTFDYHRAIQKLNRKLKHGTFPYGREWPYICVEPCIIAEKYLVDDVTSELRDYKFFCFNGEVKYSFIATNRQNASEPTCFDFFDRDFTHLNIKHGHPNAKIKPEKPKNYYLMLELAEKLSKDLIQCRVDFYEVNGKVFFGEITLFHHSGFCKFDPEEWDLTFGESIILPID